LSGARLIDGLLRPAGSPLVGVFCDDVLFLLPLAPVFGLAGWSNRDLSVLVGSELLGLPDWAIAAIGRQATAAARMTIILMGSPSRPVELMAALMR
jgi:hypothetical protein